MDKVFEYKDAQYPILCQWFMKRNLNFPQPELLPKTGYVVDGVACGFIYMTDSSIAILDGFISNPEASKTTIDRALDAIVMHLINYAKQCGCTLLICNSKISTIGTRARKWGFRDTGEHQSFAKEI